VALSENISLKICQQALKKIKKIPGRMEIVIKNPFWAIVDYAHTLDSLKKVYQALKNFFPSSKLICVFGACGGGRDKWKRPEIGKIAQRFCDKIILTNEDPYDEDPVQILSMIKSGIFKSQSLLYCTKGSGLGFSISNFYEILDRREAIRKALVLSKPNDILIITGKGTESWMCLEKGKRIPWDDREILKEEFAKLKSKNFSSAD